MANGSCLCGQIAFETTGTPIRVSQCHCSRCRKSRGNAYGSHMVLPIEGVRYLRGRELISTYRVPEAKYFMNVFCSACGSPMPRLDEGRGLAIIPMGAFDEDPGARPMLHMFVGSKVSWDEIADDLPQHAAAPPAPLR